MGVTKLVGWQLKGSLECFACLQAAERGVKRIRVHTLTDGRDCEDGTSIKLMETLQKDLQALEKQGVDARVASGGGRMCTTMDRYEVLRHPHAISAWDVSSPHCFCTSAGNTLAYQALRKDK